MEPSEELQLYLSSGSDHVGPQNRLCVPLDLLAGPGDDGAQSDHRRALGAGLLGSGAAQPHEEDQGAGEEPNPSHDGLKEEEKMMMRKKAEQQKSRLKDGFCWREATERDSR